MCINKKKYIKTQVIHWPILLGENRLTISKYGLKVIHSEPVISCG
jgi:hypothetical protein